MDALWGPTDLGFGLMALALITLSEFNSKACDEDRFQLEQMVRPVTVLSLGGLITRFFESGFMLTGTIWEHR
jgi:hypothetical protein